KRSNSEPTYLNSVMAVKICGFRHERRVIAGGNESNIGPVGKHKESETRGNRDKLNHHHGERTCSISRPARYSSVREQPDRDHDQDAEPGKQGADNRADQ